jgi:plasmid stabilization system protein ParE
LPSGALALASYRLTPLASEQVIEILEYGLEAFGPTKR